jgi:hypothetical protein
MTVGSSGRDGDIEAFVVDRYLESLLARRPVATDGVPAELGATAHRLAAGLPRYHPSFRFEERLAAELAAAASRIRAGEVVELPVVRGQRAPDAPPDRPVVHPVVIGGVLTSAALSLAGAAFVAWRRSHAPAAPMSRAARAVARTRLV